MPGRVFNSFLIFFGVTTIFLAVGAMTQTSIELELNQFFGKRRVRNMIDKLEGHIILCGFGRVGRGAAEELRKAGAPFVVIDNNEERVERAMKAGMLAVLADASRDEALRDVGIARAKGLIATLASDADNLFVILSAKTLNPNLQLSARIAEESSEQKMRRAGADFVFAPYNSTGHRMAQAHAEAACAAVPGLHDAARRGRGDRTVARDRAEQFCRAERWRTSTSGTRAAWLSWPFAKPTARCSSIPLATSRCPPEII